MNCIEADNEIKMKKDVIKFELVSCFEFGALITSNSKLIGGWVVHTYSEGFESMVFIPDKNHSFFTEQ